MIHCRRELPIALQILDLQREDLGALTKDRSRTRQRCRRRGKIVHHLGLKTRNPRMMPKHMCAVRRPTKPVDRALGLA